MEQSKVNLFTISFEEIEHALSHVPSLTRTFEETEYKFGLTSSLKCNSETNVPPLTRTTEEVEFRQANSANEGAGEVSHAPSLTRTFEETEYKGGLTAPLIRTFDEVKCNPETNVPRLTRTFEEVEFRHANSACKGAEEVSHVPSLTRTFEETEYKLVSTPLPTKTFDEVKCDSESHVPPLTRTLEEVEYRQATLANTLPISVDAHSEIPRLSGIFEGAGCRQSQMSMVLPTLLPTSDISGRCGRLLSAATILDSSSEIRALRKNWEAVCLDLVHGKESMADRDGSSHGGAHPGRGIKFLPILRKQWSRILSFVADLEWDMRGG
jgi:hypothetical protein